MSISPVAAKIDENAKELDGMLAIGLENVLQTEIVGSHILHHLLNF